MMHVIIEHLVGFLVQLGMRHQARIVNTFCQEYAIRKKYQA